MTTLDALIDGLSDDNLSTSNALRKFLVVGKRLKSDAIVDWANGELNGLNGVDVEDYPIYRGPIQVPVQVFFTGPFGAWQKHLISAEDVPDETNFRQVFFNCWFDESLAELEQLAQHDGTLSKPWPFSAVATLNRWSESGRAISVEMHQAHSVERIVSTALLRGIIDSVRNKALMLALDLQSDFPDAGEVGGPTVHDKEVRNVVKYHFETHIHGGTNTIGQGENITQNVTVGQGENVTQNVAVNLGDSEALMAALKDLGLALEDRKALAQALENDGNKPGSAVKEFLGKLATGAIKIVGSVATEPILAGVKLAITGFTGVPVV
ncbi:hypothetical protein ACIPYU_18365 [Paenarthrobacter nicotinovorans]|uniref:AbiTii domain-containing protein n=1 Tax=Paenarthrobacter nicotinovorans TaxID=29320 RepID=UPI0037FF6AD0